MNEMQAPEGAPREAVGEVKKDYTKWIIGGVVAVVLLYGAQYMFSPQRAIEKSVERSIERATGDKVDVDMDRTIGGDTKTTFTGANGEQYNMTTGDEVSLPDNWPSNVPIPNDAKVTYSGSVLNGQEGGGLTVVYTTSQSAADVTEYYKSELTSKGWTLQGTIATAQGSMVSASLSEKQNIVVYVSSADNETTVSITAQMSE